ncbi:MAG: serine/threonine-protein kinase, partial [Chloroflexi bacterium]|nr:serine/threonine-protein kinase [Chloroflexota bacterium]
VFSLALIFLERIAGAPPSRLRLPEGGVRLPPAEEGWWGYLPQATVEAVTDLLTAALSRGPLAPPDAPDAHRPSAAEVADALEPLARPPQPAPEPESERLLDGRYRVVSVLGEGSFARTLLVEDTVMPGLFAVKQYLRPAQIGETGEARREFEALRQLISPHLPRVFDVYSPRNDVHVKLEYVAGQSLRAALPGFRGELERCRRLAHDLLEAVEQLERRGLLHRDIKPDNVILRDDGDAVLIDFGSATPAGTLIGIDGATPLYLPPEALFADQPPPSADRYALAAVLLQALTGRPPIADTGALLSDHALDGLPDGQRQFAAPLLRSVSPNPTERYASAAELRSALFPPQAPVSPPTGPRPALEERTNEWVDSVRGLYRNSVRGNADNRGLDSEFARQTYVPTALDTVLLEKIVFERPRAVFLSGNPGDGKTAFLETVKDALQLLDATQREDDVSGWVSAPAMTLPKRAAT